MLEFGGLVPRRFGLPLSETGVGNIPGFRVGLDPATSRLDGTRHPLIAIPSFHPYDMPFYTRDAPIYRIYYTIRCRRGDLPTNCISSFVGNFPCRDPTCKRRILAPASRPWMPDKEARGAIIRQSVALSLVEYIQRIMLHIYV